MYSVLLNSLFDIFIKLNVMVNYLMQYINNISWANLFFNMLYVISDDFYHLRFLNLQLQDRYQIILQQRHVTLKNVVCV